jgi:hypothetical protein
VHTDTIIIISLSAAGGHASVQALHAVDFGADEYVKPSEQLWQDVEFGAAEYVPAAHSAHAEDLGCVE